MWPFGRPRRAVVRETPTLLAAFGWTSVPDLLGSRNGPMFVRR
ncbi:hypothetical protein MMSP_3977 [Mycobacterium sp. 012931]|nr:hypothetical protein MMSP_3977 [Mycobacterium sp. 012931]